MPAIARPLLDWYARHRRDLAWRRTDDPWAILVSEVMLQQTRVEVVEAYWRRFLARFPDPRSLATADDDELLALWAGLGYYRRARFLKAAAAAIVDRHGGRFPADFEALLALPGVGRYTAGAVASIAFDLPRPVVDGNVARVFSRLFLVDGDPTRGPAQRRLWALAEQHLDRDRPGDFNQAVMELGALVCTPKRPDCSSCPLAGRCEARARDVVGEYPAPRARRETIEVRLAAAVLRRGDEVALLRRAPGSRMAGLLDLPSIELEVGDDAGRRLARWLTETFGLRAPSLGRVGEARHGITHHRITAEVYEAELRPGTTPAAPAADTPPPGARGIAAPPDGDGLRFRSARELSGLGLSALGRKLLAAAADPGPDDEVSRPASAP